MKKTSSIAVVIIAAIAVALAIKAFVFNPPSQTPEEITRQIVEYIQNDNPTEEETNKIQSYYKTEVFENFEDTTNTESGDSSGSSDVVVEIKSMDKGTNTATATLEFSVLTITIPVQLKFEKEGDFIAGYKWLIVDVVGAGDDSDSSAKESSVSPNEKADIGGGFFIAVSTLSDHNPKDYWEQTEEGNKYVAVEITYFNESNSSDTVNPSNLSLRDSEGHSYDQTYMSSKEPSLEIGTTVTPGSSAKGYVTYEVPENVNIVSAIYSNVDSIVIIKF